MPEQRHLADHTTLRLGGPAARWAMATSEEQLIDAASTADAGGEPMLLLGGGSNLVVADSGFTGTVVEIRTEGVTIDEETRDAVLLTVAAGESWDELVGAVIGQGWAGIEALAGIPGLVGATPIQNVGAYGQEIAQTVVSVRVWDRVLRGVRTFANDECGFGYRTSRFKTAPGRHVVLDVTFKLKAADLGAPLEYAELAAALGVKLGARAPLDEVREAVLALRRGKGMVLDPEDHDTWSAGSFFTNPVVYPIDVPYGAPTWPQPDGRVKTSAAWLIEQAGFTKGYGAGPVSLSTKHTLALTNRGGATTSQLLALAREVRDGVEERHRIRLVTEPRLVGCVV